MDRATSGHKMRRVDPKTGVAAIDEGIATHREGYVADANANRDESSGRFFGR
jgi:hypothetical protein